MYFLCDWTRKIFDIPPLSGSSHTRRLVWSDFWNYYICNNPRSVSARSSSSIDCTSVMMKYVFGP